MRCAPIHADGMFRPSVRGCFASCCTGGPTEPPTRFCCAIFFRPMWRWKVLSIATEKSPPLGAFAIPEVYRSGAIRSDLEALCGANWTALRLLPAAERYARHIAALSNDDAVLIIAHAYVRYLGDLNGGQILKRVLGKTLGLGAESLTFYDFPHIADLPAFTRQYRSRFDRSEPLIGAVGPLLAEADIAFRFNIELSEEVLGGAA